MDGTGMIDLNTALANAAVTFRVKRDEARAAEQHFKAESESPRDYPFRKHNLAMADGAGREAESWEAMRLAAVDGVLLIEHAPDAPVRRLSFYEDLRAACVQVGRFRLGPHAGGDTSDRDGSVRPGATADGQGPGHETPTTPKGKPTIG